MERSGRRGLIQRNPTWSMNYCDMDAENPKSTARVADFVSGVLQKEVAGMNFGLIDPGLNVIRLE